MTRIVHRWLSGLLTLLMLLLVTVGWLAGSESGLRLLWQELISPAFPALAIGTLHGQLAGSIRVSDLRYEDDRLMFAAQSLRLDWEPAALLEGLLRIRMLAAEGVQYEQRSAGDGEPVILPERFSLPVAIEVTELSVHDLTVIGAPQARPLPFTAASLSGTYHGNQLEITRLHLQHPAADVTGGLTLQTAAGFTLAGELHWQASLPEHAPLIADTRLSGNLQSLRIEQSVAPPYALQLDLTLHELLTALRLDGTLAMQDSDLAAINAAWPDMHLDGSIAARGTPDALQLDGTMDIRDAMTGAAQLVFAGRLLPHALQFDALQLTSAGRPVRLDAQGRIGLGAQPVFDFQAQWQSLAWPLDGAPVYQSRQGQLSLNGTPDNYRIDAHGDLKWQDLLTGELALRAHSSDTPGNWQIDAASLTGGKAKVEAAGQVGNVYALDWRVDAPRLTDLSPEAAGSLQGRGSLNGPPEKLAMVARASGANIKFRDYHLGKLDLDGEINLARDRPLRLRAAISSANLAGTQVTRLELDGSGTTAQHRLRLVADTAQGDAELEAGGRWDGKRWRFTLQQARLEYPHLAPWQLVQPVSGELTGGRLQLPEHCWRSAPARACLRFDGTASDYRGGVVLTALPLEYFSALLPETVSLQGELNGRGEFSATARNAASIDVQLDTTPVRLGLPLEAEEETTQQPFSFAPGRVVFTLRRQQAALRVDLPMEGGQGGVQVRADLTAPAGGDWLQAALDGELTLHWPDIGLARHWIPDVAELQGQIDGRLRLAGTPASPHVQGRLALTQASARLKTPGLTLEDIAIELAGQPAGDIRIEGQARSGGGTLQGHGLLNPGDRSAHIQLVGTDFQVMNTPEAKIFASPDLQLVLTAEQARVTGQIGIPRAHLTPRRPPPTAVTVSPDQVIVTEAGQGGTAARYRVDSRVRIVLGENVDIDGLGLTGKLRGDVLLIDPPGQPASATGELSIRDGRYDAYGQKLSITTGRLLFAGGAVTEPGLDIKAERKPNPDVTVGVVVRGSLLTPEFSVYSKPAMSQSAQLSWLVLGRPPQSDDSDDTSDSESSALQSAALLLGLNQGESFGKRVKEQIGLDEVTISKEAGADTTQSSLLVGKYLTPDLFVSYGIGLFEPAATLRLRYALSSRWKLVGETAATSSSADLYYEIERR